MFGVVLSWFSKCWSKINFFRQLFEKKENETLMCPIGLSGSFHDLFEVCWVDWAMWWIVTKANWEIEVGDSFILILAVIEN